MNGTEASPWKTIGYAITQMTGGDTLIVKGGLYPEVVNFSGLDGTSEKRTVVMAAPGHEVTIQGAGVNSGRIKITSDHFTFEGFTVTNLNQGIFIQDDADYVTVKACKVHHVGQEGIHVKGNSDHILIEDCVIRDTRQWQYNGEGIYIGTGSAGPVDNTSHVTIRNNTIYNTTDEAIELKPGTHDCVIEGNTIYNIGTPASVGAIEIGPHTVGVQNWNGNPNHVVRQNVISNCLTAIRVDTGCDTYNNIVYDLSAGGFGIYVGNPGGDSYQRRIYHNTIHLSAATAISVGAGDVDIKNNIGPSDPGNIETSSSFFFSTTAGEEVFSLVNGAAPINAGVTIPVSIAFAIDGLPRLEGVAPDMGAYEFQESAISAPLPPENVRVVPTVASTP